MEGLEIFLIKNYIPPPHQRCAKKIRFSCIPSTCGEAYDWSPHVCLAPVWGPMDGRQECSFLPLNVSHLAIFALQLSALLTRCDNDNL